MPRQQPYCGELYGADAEHDWNGSDSNDQSNIVRSTPLHVESSCLPTPLAQVRTVLSILREDAERGLRTGALSAQRFPLRPQRSHSANGRQCGPRRPFFGVAKCEGELMNKRHVIAVAATVAIVVFGSWP